MTRMEGIEDGVIGELLEIFDNDEDNNEDNDEDDDVDGGNWGRGHQGNYLRFLRAQLSSWKLVDCNQPFPCTQFNIANISLLMIQIHNITSLRIALSVSQTRQHTDKATCPPTPPACCPFGLLHISFLCGPHIMWWQNISNDPILEEVKECTSIGVANAAAGRYQIWFFHVPSSHEIYSELGQGGCSCVVISRSRPQVSLYVLHWSQHNHQLGSGPKFLCIFKFLH